MVCGFYGAASHAIHHLDHIGNEVEGIIAYLDCRYVIEGRGSIRVTSIDANVEDALFLLFSHLFLFCNKSQYQYLKPLLIVAVASDSEHEAL